MPIDLVTGAVIRVEQPGIPVFRVASPPGSVTLASSGPPTVAVLVGQPGAPVLRGTPPGGSTVTVVPVSGPPGPPGPIGPPGQGGGAYFVYTQSAPAATWIIDHGLGRLVNITVLDTGNDVVFADVIQGTPDQATIVFAQPTAGAAVLS